MNPILAAMRHNPLGPVLVAVQMALTLAIVSNSVFIVHERLARMVRPTGLDESRLFTIKNQWIGKPNDIEALVQTDLAALRSLPGVVDTYATNSYPLNDFPWTFPVTLDPEDASAGTLAGAYLADNHALRTLGLRLIAGRDFSADDVRPYAGPGTPSVPPPDGVIVTRQLAELLAPRGSALGRLLTIDSFPITTAPASVPVVGVVDRLQVAMADLPVFTRMRPFSSVLIPYRYEAATAYYMVRSESAGEVAPLMKAATDKLYRISRERVLPEVRSLSDVRRQAYRGDRGEAVMLGAVSVIVLGMTAWGIVGLTSCWVNQRRRHIGIRRALGATRTSIVRYFQVENFLIATAGIVPGAALAIAANLWLIDRFQMPRMGYRYAVVGAIIVFLLGQVATLWPALRAASVPPAEATRTV